MILKFEDVIFGKKMIIIYNCEEQCEICGGFGVKLGMLLVICLKCYGVGYIQVQINMLFG